MSSLTVNARVAFLLGDRHFEHPFSLAELKSVSAPVLDAAMVPIRSAMQKANIKPGELDMVLLAGGSSQLPGVRERVVEATGVEPMTFPRDLMYAVAYGAALYHHRIFQLPLAERETRILGDGLGLLVNDGGVISVRLMLSHNAKLPAKFQHEFDIPEGQEIVTINLRRGNHSEAGKTTPLRSKDLRLRRRADKVSVVVEVDRNRIIKLSAFDPGDPQSEVVIEVTGDVLDDQGVEERRKQIGIEVRGTIASPSSAGHPCLGIDLGTTTCELAYVNRTGAPRPQCLENPDPTEVYDNHCYPSVVYFPGAIGAPEVANRVALEAWEDPERRERAFRSFKADDWSKVLGFIGGIPVTAEVLSAHLLAKIWSDAKASHLGASGDLRSAVITVPAAFGPDECRDVYNAARLAGITEVTLIDEPTAAFLYYRHKFPSIATSGVRTALVFDFGGGTADVAILDVSNDPVVAPGQHRHVLYAIRATDGDSNCGGRRVDQLIAEHFRKAFETKYHVSLDSQAGALYRLKQAAERYKVELATQAYGQDSND